MTVPADLTFTDIQTRVANQLRVPVSNTTELAKIAALINEVYRDLYVKHDWWFLLHRAVINTLAFYNTGSLNVTLGSTTATFSTDAGNPPAAALIPTPDHTVLSVDANALDAQAIYKVSSYSTAGVGTLTFDAALTCNTSTAAGYHLFHDAYDLPSDAGKVLIVKRFGEILPMKPIGIEEMSQLKISDQSTGKPEAWSVYDFHTTGNPNTTRCLIVHPYPDRAYRLELYYKQQLNTELSGTTQPFMPDEYRHILIYGALARGYPIWLNDLERGKFFQSLFNDVLALMVIAHREHAADLPQLVPDDTYRQHNRRRKRTATTLGTLFDRFPTVP